MRKVTLTVTGTHDVFGAMPWIMVLPKESRTAQCDGTCHGRLPLYAIFRDVGNKNETERRKAREKARCKSKAAYVYIDVEGTEHRVCFSHIHSGLMEKDAEQKRMAAWIDRCKDQPPEVDIDAYPGDDGFEPNVLKAANRIINYVSAWGDGRIAAAGTDEQDATKEMYDLYARDLAAVAQFVRERHQATKGADA